MKRLYCIVGDLLHVFLESLWIRCIVLSDPIGIVYEAKPSDEPHVLFEDMLDVDFAVIPKRRGQQLMQDRIPRESAVQISNVFRRGMRVILDEDGTAAQLRKIISSFETLVLDASFLGKRIRLLDMEKIWEDYREHLLVKES